MLIGTLSFERKNMEMHPPSAERAAMVLEAARRGTDILVCAGWTLDFRHELEVFSQALAETGTDTAVFLEVRYEKDSTEPSDNMNYLLRGASIYGLGRQVFAEAEEFEKKKDAYNAAWKDKSAILDGRTITLLCCGEINVLEGRDDPKPRDGFQGNLLQADIIVNPTHDRMGQAGTLQAKRRWLSQRVDQRNRIYISASNWNSAKLTRKADKITCQKPTPSLHTVFSNGAEVTEFVEPRLTDDRCVYREYEVSI